MLASKLKFSKPEQAIQKAVSPKAAKLGKQPGKVVAPKTAPKTKKAKMPSKVQGKKITGVNNKSKLKGKPVTKKAIKGLYRSK